MRGGTVNKDGLMGKIPRPLDVVHSGNTTTIRLGFCLIYVSKSTNLARIDGLSLGYENARQTAVKRDIGSTSLVFG